MLVTVIALDVRQTLDVGEPTARACLAVGTSLNVAFIVALILVKQGKLLGSVHMYFDATDPWVQPPTGKPEQPRVLSAISKRM